MPAEAHSPPVELDTPSEEPATITDIFADPDKFREPAAATGGPDDETEDDDRDDGSDPEATKPELKKPEAKPEKLTKKQIAENLAAEEAAFSDDALKTKDGLVAAREIIRAARAAAETRTHILDRYDMRSKRTMAEAREMKAAAEALSARVEPVRQALIRDVNILREPGVTAKEKLAALSRLAGGRAAHEVYDELTSGILADGKIEQADPRVPQLQAALAESNARFEQFLQQQQAAQVDGQTAAQKAQIQAVYTHVAEAAEDAESYPSIAAGIAAEDWTPEEVAEKVAGPDGIMVKHFKRHGERLDKLEALRILEARLARHRASGQGPAAGVAGSGTTKKPGSPTRGAGKGTTITPSVADRSAGSRRELETVEERIADLSRDPAALRQLLPMFAE